MNMNQRKHHMKSTVALKVDGVSYEHHAALAEQLNATIKERDDAQHAARTHQANFIDCQRRSREREYAADRSCAIGVVVAFIAGLACGLINLFVNL